MELVRIDPSLRDVARKAPRPHLERALTRHVFSRLSRLIPGATVDGVQREILRDKRLRVYTPGNRSGAALIWLHSGGFILGTAKQDDTACAHTAMETGAVVVSVDYRLATQAPFPAALDDAYNGYHWLSAESSTLGIDPSRIAVGGRSSGAGLATCLAQRLHDEDVTVRGQWLFCPMLDDRTALDVSLDLEDHFVWNNRMNRAGWSTYLGDRDLSDAPPRYAVPARRSDYTGLAPTWIYTSDTDLFYQEAVSYARDLSEAGVDTTLHVVNGAPHAFEMLAPNSPAATALLTAANAWFVENI